MRLEPAASLVSLLTSADARSAPGLSFLFDGSESYLKPFLADDSVLFSLPHNAKEAGEEAEEGEEDDDEEQKAADAGAAEAQAPGLPSLSALLRENQSLRNELESMAEAMSTMQTALKRVAFQEEDDDASKVPALDTAAASSSAVVVASSSSSAPTSTPAEIAAAKAAKAASAAGGNPGSFAPEHVDRDYFGGYSTRNIHELMLRDTVRTEAYRDFIYNNPDLFKGKVVLDVGCGTGTCVQAVQACTRARSCGGAAVTWGDLLPCLALSLFVRSHVCRSVCLFVCVCTFAGILSMFAARAGASRVIAVDAADIVHKAREIISANGLSGVISVLHGKMEEVVLPVDKVDIIISEWMGYFLLFESMLPSVLYARDKYLRAAPGPQQSLQEATGVYPDQALMYMCGIETTAASARKVDWWSSVYGFDMSCLVDASEKFMGSTVEVIRPSQVLTDRPLLQKFDCNFVQDRALDFAADVTLKVGPIKGDKAVQQMSGFMVYFDTLFALHCKETINLSTAPVDDRAPLPELTTHWQQSVFYLAKPLEVKEGDEVRATLTAKRMIANPRAYHVLLDYTLVRDGQAGTRCSQEYHVQ